MNRLKLPTATHHAENSSPAANSDNSIQTLAGHDTCEPCRARNPSGQLELPVIQKLIPKPAIRRLIVPVVYSRPSCFRPSLRHNHPDFRRNPQV
ncbi:MAG: hypothetical protein JO189_16035 [Deltaproteobacteria bacterium]|nr:hypothetical protein [Deltaproteobacteria bacterium]